jgi:hypothetical protein
MTVSLVVAQPELVLGTVGGAGQRDQRAAHGLNERAREVFEPHWKPP